jgi:adenylate cyclase
VSAPARSPAARRSTAAGRLLDGLSVGVAVADASTWALRDENERFRTWFPPADGEDSLLARVPGLDPQAARTRLARGRPFRIPLEVARGARSLGVEMEIRPLPDAEGEWLVEVRDVSRQREAEYMLDSYSRLVERREREMRREQERAERLLLNIMPRSVYEELKDSGTTTPQRFPAASVLMLDFVGFTEMAISRDAGALVAELNDIFTSFDRIIEHQHCERIKTIGDAYMAVAGVPEPDPDHAVNLARAAVRMRRYLERRNAASSVKWRFRIGLGCGALIGSIVGIHKYVYDVFGPAVNLASRLESLAEPGQILLCADTCDRIRDELVVRPAGVREVRGFGEMPVHELVDEARPGH